MKRFTSVVVLSAALCNPIPASGQSAVSSYVAQLEHQGYAEISVQRTLLGRTKITASRDGVTREIVVARNGQVLFDYRNASDKEPSVDPVAPSYGDDGEHADVEEEPSQPVKPSEAVLTSRVKKS